MTTVVARNGEREISASPGKIVFATSGSPLSQDVTLTNTGSAAVAIYDVACDRAFEVLGKTCGSALAAGASCTISVQPTAYYQTEGLLVILTSAGPICIVLSTGLECPSALVFRISDPSGPKIQLANGARYGTCTGNVAGPASAQGATLVQALANAAAAAAMGTCSPPLPFPCDAWSYYVGPCSGRSVQGLCYLQAAGIDNCGASAGISDFWKLDAGYQFPQTSSGNRTPTNLNPLSDDITVIFQPTGQNSNQAQYFDALNQSNSTKSVIAIAATNEGGLADPHSAIAWAAADGGALSLPFDITGRGYRTIKLTHSYTGDSGNEGGFIDVTRFLTITTDDPTITDTIASVSLSSDNRSNYITLTTGSPMPAVGQLIMHASGDPLGAVLSVDASTKTIGVRYPGDGIATQSIKWGPKYQLQLIGGQWTTH